MSTPLEPLTARLQALEDKEEIRTLIARYGPLADQGDAEGVAQLWTEDGSYAITGFGTAQGRAEIAGFITGATHKQLMADGCAHVMGPVAIDLRGDHATARGHSLVLRWTGSAFEVARVAANCWTLKRLPEGWRVTHRDNAQLKGDAAAFALFAGV